MQAKKKSYLMHNNYYDKTENHRSAIYVMLLVSLVA